MHEVHDGNIDATRRWICQRGLRRLLQRLLESHPVAAAAFPPGPGGLRRDTYDDYRRVNALFADKLGKQLRPDDVVWVHDYHLIPLAQRCCANSASPTASASSCMCRCLPLTCCGDAEPRRVVLLAAAYDLVGFQTERDLDRFQSYVRLFGGGKVYADGRLRKPQDGRASARAHSPSASIPRMIARQAAAAISRASVLRLRESLAQPRARDRRGSARLLQGAARSFPRVRTLAGEPSRTARTDHLPAARAGLARRSPEYQALRRELEGLAGHINGRHAAPEWTPVRYVNRDFSHGVLTGFYRSADIGLVTPLRDGMNLVAKEFVASQDPEKPGVLVLSRFAGAAAEMHEALIVNPYDVDGVADALAHAHAMPMDERKERWHALHKRLQKHDITLWRRKFLEALAA
jgi:trehalose 6-phosphate synthase